ASPFIRTRTAAGSTPGRSTASSTLSSVSNTSSAGEHSPASDSAPKVRPNSRKTCRISSAKSPISEGTTTACIRERIPNDRIDGETHNGGTGAGTGDGSWHGGREPLRGPVPGTGADTGSRPLDVASLE